MHIQRALFFPWKRGVSERLVIADLDQFTSSLRDNQIPIMKNLTINYNKITSIAIAGNSGSGKSYTLTYLLNILKPMSDLIIVDPNLIHQAVGQEKMIFLSFIQVKIALSLTLYLKLTKI